MRQDVINAIRSFKKSPTFTVVSLVVMALGIGAATALFSVVDAVVLRGLPFDTHDRLVAVLEFDTTRPVTFGGGTTTPQTFLDWRQQQESFEGLTAVGSTTYRLRNESGEPAAASASRVTWEFFPLLRVAPLAGRPFTADDEVQGRHRVVILSYGFWQRRFGGAADVIGKTIDLNEEPWDIVGVMPADFSYPVASQRPSELFTPVAFTSEERVRAKSRNYNWTTIGRLKNGITVPQAHDQMNRLMDALKRQYPDWSTNHVQVVSLHHYLVGRVRPWMLMLLGAVAVLLVIACANVANLMVARATTRSREIAVRAALGASRWRVLRGLLVEGVVLSCSGAIIGLALAYAGVQMIKAWLPAGLPRVAAIAIDLRILLAASAAALLTGIFFGIVPALHSSRPDLASTLKESGRSSTTGAGGHRLRNALVVAEVALAVVLLVGAGLFSGSFIQLIRVDPGFNYRNVLTFNVALQATRGLKPGTPAYEDAARRGRAHVGEVVDALRRLPGVTHAAAVQGGLPLTGNWSRTRLELPGKPVFRDDDSIDVRTVTPDYLQLLRVPLKRGRHLAATDNEGAEAVVVVNEAAAKKYWPGQEVLGQRVRINDRDRVVVGVVGDIRHLGPETPVRQECYITYAQTTASGGTVVVRTAGDPLALLPAAKTAVWAINPEQRFTGDVFTMEGYMDRLIAQRRFNMAMLVLFGVLALVITAAGIYGVMAYLVEQRTNEIGLRMALGATPGRVVSMVLRRASVLIVIGLAVGAAVAWSLSSSVQAFLFETKSSDARIFALALAVLTISGLVASGVPARRAAHVDPLVALRQE
jgi:putative ABC transport system permease protein